jgi:hypothetical protein
MAQPQGNPANGVAFRGSDGAIYFIRDEVMESCRVTEKDMSDALGQLIDGQGDVSGFSTTGDPVGDSVRITGGTSRPTAAMASSGGGLSTTMCPW